MTGGILPLGDERAHDPLDVSREVIVECSQRLAMYAGMVMDLATVRDDDGTNLMFGRAVVELKGIKGALEAIGEVREAREKQAKHQERPAT